MGGWMGVRLGLDGMGVTWGIESEHGVNEVMGLELKWGLGSRFRSVCLRGRGVCLV